MLHQTFLFLGQLWQLFEVSQILEFLRYCYTFNLNSALFLYDKCRYSIIQWGGRVV